ncbi:MAG: lytic murein transglycosylase [Alphaproteobacteria bacterium]|nr:lytic murein transglycosylase [Alphaproteobacteria bacterium]
MKIFILSILALAGFSFSVLAQDVPHNALPFSQWLDAFKRDAESAGVSRKTIEEAFSASEAPIDQIITLDRKQPEGTMTLSKYLKSAVNNGRVSQGRELFEEHKDILTQVSKKYGVPPQYIVALWGIETNFGENTGNFSVFDSLATLAYDGRRSAYFRDELIKALKIVDSDHISLDNMVGSWAGAMGQCQFMPTSFFEYAVDFDGDGQRDIWTSQPDVFASIANYLHSSGWKESEGWGVNAMLPTGFDASLADIKQSRRFSEWQKLGVKIQGEAIAPSASTSLILVGEGPDARALVITDNYKIILKWNRSRFFGTAVSELADRIAE